MSNYTIYSQTQAGATVPLRVLPSYSKQWSNLTYRCLIQTMVFENHEYLGEFKAKLENIKRGLSGAYMQMLNEKPKTKSLVTLPLYGKNMKVTKRLKT
jgi:hypothetical protein